VTLAAALTSWALWAIATWWTFRVWCQRADAREETMECQRSKQLRESGRVKTTEQWLHEHRDHGDIEEQPYTANPGGQVRVLVCECGAELLTMAKGVAA
jgi:hypothetical protein